MTAPTPPTIALAELFDLPALAAARQCAPGQAPPDGPTLLRWAAPLLRLPPHRLALQLAVMGAELPGWDNGDRAGLRRVAYALAGGAPDCRRQALGLCAELVEARGRTAFSPSRHELVLLLAVTYLLALIEPAARAARAAPEGAPPEPAA